MKKSHCLISALLICCITILKSQESVIELVFTADYQEQYIPLDSILINNLTQNSDTILYNVDTILNLSFITGVSQNINRINQSFRTSQNYPNPAYDKTTFIIYNSSEKYFLFDVKNVHGHNITHFEKFLEEGSHSFDFLMGNDVFYLVMVTDGITKQTLKILNSKSTNRSECSIKYNGDFSTNTTQKHSADISEFVFEPGDKLRFTGYSHFNDTIVGSDVIEDIVEENKFYTFSIKYGIPCHTAPLVEYDNKQYTAIQIGQRCWLRENLDVGIMIEGVEEMTDNNTIEKYCYGNLEENCEVYGGLYQWHELMQYSTQNQQGLCPPGWRIPDDEEWKMLEGSVDSQFGVGDMEWDIEGWRGYDAGYNLKSEYGWNQGGDGSNIYGFTDLPSSYRNYDGTFLGILGEVSYFWTSKHFEEYYAFCRIIDYYFNGVIRTHLDTEMGFSARCIKDQK